MMNYVILAGRITENVKIVEREYGDKEAYITLAIPRNFKNKYGIYETDFINCTLKNGVAEQTAEYCHKSDMVVIKGKLQNINGSGTYVIVEKVTFLSSSKKEDK